MITYVSYQPHHHAAIERLGEEIFDDKHLFRVALRDADPKSIITLYKRQVVGFALLKHTRLFRHLDAIEVAYLVVRPDFQGKGIGSTLLQKVKEMSPTVVLDVSWDNQNAERLYRSKGFDIWRHLGNKINGGYLMGYSSERHERMLRLRSREHPPADGTAAQ